MDIQGIVADGQLIVAMGIALLAGLVSFVSPCVLPLVPGYLAYVGASADAAAHAHAPDNTPAVRRAAQRRTVWGAVLFVLGITLVLTVMMGVSGSLGLWLIEWQDMITRVMGVIVTVMGLVFMGLFSQLQTTRKLALKPRTGVWGAPLLGVVFAIGWTPCLAPTLATIMSLSLQQGSVPRSVLLAIAYSLGLGIPFVLAAFGFGWMTRSMSFFRRHIRAVNLIGGALLVGIGVCMVLGVWTQLMSELQVVIGGYVTPL